MVAAAAIRVSDRMGLPTPEQVGWVSLPGFDRKNPTRSARYVPQRRRLETVQITSRIPTQPIMKKSAPRSGYLEGLPGWKRSGGPWLRGGSLPLPTSSASA